MVGLWRGRLMVVIPRVGVGMWDIDVQRRFVFNV
jgi:hypothetical protein